MINKNKKLSAKYKTELSKKVKSLLHKKTSNEIHTILNIALFFGIFSNLFMFIFIKYLHQHYFNNLSINKCDCATNISSYNNIKTLIQIKLNIYLTIIALYVFLLLMINISSYTEHLSIQLTFYTIPLITFFIYIFNIYFTVMLTLFMYDYHNKECKCQDNIRKNIIIFVLIIEIIFHINMIYKFIMK